MNYTFDSLQGARVSSDLQWRSMEDSPPCSPGPLQLSDDALGHFPISGK